MYLGDKCLLTKQKFNYGQGGKEYQTKIQENCNFSSSKFIKIIVRSEKHLQFRENHGQDKKWCKQKNVRRILAVCLTKLC